MIDAVQIFKALGDPNRLRIMKMLEKRELCVCEIRAVLGLSNSTVSEHLSMLKSAGMILDRKDGKWINYRLNDNVHGEFAKAVMKALENHLGSDHALQADNIKVKKVDRKKICCAVGRT